MGCAQEAPVKVAGSTVEGLACPVRSSDFIPCSVKVPRGFRPESNMTCFVFEKFTLQVMCLVHHERNRGRTSFWQEWSSKIFVRDMYCPKDFPSFIMFPNS